MWPEIRFSCIGLLFFGLTMVGVRGQSYVDLLRQTDLSFDEVVSLTELSFDKKGRDRGSGYKQFKRWEYFTRRSLMESGRPLSKADLYRRYRSFLNVNDGFSTRSTASNWVEMGPVNVTNTSSWSSHIGRISALDVDINNDQHLLVGAPTGGVWRSVDEGLHWTPIFDEMAMLDVYAVHIDRSNPDHYLIGTNGLGIQYSVDAGQTWQQASGIGSGDLINRIVMHPTDSMILLACGQRGKIFRSTDNGLSWTTVYEDVNQPYMFDLEFKPDQVNVIYASGEGFVLKSLDTGLNFSPLSGPWGNGSMMMAVTEAEPDFLYVLQEENEGFYALFRSTDGGNSFDTQSDNSGGNNNIMGYFLNQSGGQAPRDMDVVVSPTNPEEVHVGGIMTFRSLDGGVSWEQTSHWIHSNPLPFIHADCDIIHYQNNKIYFGTDGGFFISPDAGTSFIDRTEGLGIRQLYRIGVSDSHVHRVSGGSQDNGTGVVSAGVWKDFVGADGMETYIDKNNEDMIFGSIQFGDLYRSTNGGNTGININEAPGSGDWVTPLEQDPIISNRLYQGKQQVYRSNNNGDSWTVISALTPTYPQDNKLTELAVAPSNNQVIYASFKKQLFKTGNGGSSWTDITPPGSFQNVNYIHVDPSNSEKLLVVLAGTNSKVVESENGGSSWNTISSGLPSIPAECAIYQGNTSNGIFVSMNPGIFYIDNTLNNWVLISEGMPNVRVTELEYRHGNLYAATYGRGLWRVQTSNVVGCTNPLAHNYDPGALIDNGLCMTCSDGIQNGDETGVDCGGKICGSCVVLGSDCPGVLDLEGVVISGGQYQADTLIQSNNDILGGIDVLFVAGQSIELLPNFDVELGVEFEAKIAPCVPQ